MQMDGPEGGSEIEIPELAPEPEGAPVETPQSAQADEAAAEAAAPDKAKAARKKWKREPGLALSFRRGLPVEGTVEKVIRGGYEVRIGKARGFCPHSQMDLHHVDDPEAHVGKVYRFRATQLRRGGEEAILSRRALLEEERSEEAKAVRATLIEGSVTQGHVARVTDFGVFVDLGAGVTGLVHVSEVAHGRVGTPSDAVKPGDTVQVRVLKLDEASGRISLSIRQAAEDPWESVESRYQPGSAHPGIVRRLAEFGAFVEMSPGVEALAPADCFPPAADGWQRGIEEGQSRTWRVVSVDSRRRRMSVQPIPEGLADSAPAAPEPGSRIRGRVQRAEKFGVFVWLGPGRVGLVPSSHTGTRKGTDLARAFPVGREIEVEVLEADAQARRIRLGVPGATPAPPASRPSAREQAQRQQERAPRAPEAPAAPPQTFGTSLRDALREAFKKSARES